ncbi:MAG: aminoacyl-tRNA hydrolase [Candidatus Hydrogenedentes bacterium]|nr:aminoacyl-tRNA hydrolase [Candidatus Hydrogenedentota bacterium]
MKIVAGLGNPGPRYRNTRHNLGFMLVDALADRLGVALDREKHQGLVAQAAYRGEKLLLVKPQTFMNRSGDCLARVCRNTIFDPADLLVIVDDVNLPLGRLRFRAGGSAGGHNGLKSIIERLGSPEFHRMRMGVGDDRKAAELAGHVLATFRPDERDAVNAMLDRGADAALAWVADGIGPAMNTYNGTADGN